MFECDTPYREGYFMSQDQADAVLGRLFRERSEAQKHLILLRAEARKFRSPDIPPWKNARKSRER